MPLGGEHLPRSPAVFGDLQSGETLIHSLAPNIEKTLQNVMVDTGTRYFWADPAFVRLTIACAWVVLASVRAELVLSLVYLPWLNGLASHSQNESKLY